MNRPILRSSHRNPFVVISAPTRAPVVVRRVDRATYEGRVDRMLRAIEATENRALNLAERYGFDAAEIIAISIDAFAKHLGRKLEGRKGARAERARSCADTIAHDYCRRFLAAAE